MPVIAALDIHGRVVLIVLRDEFLPRHPARAHRAAQRLPSSDLIGAAQEDRFVGWGGGLIEQLVVDQDVVQEEERGNGEFPHLSETGLRECVAEQKREMGKQVLPCFDAGKSPEPQSIAERLVARDSRARALEACPGAAALRGETLGRRDGECMNRRNAGFLRSHLGPQWRRASVRYAVSNEPL